MLKSIKYLSKICAMYVFGTIGGGVLFSAAYRALFGNSDELSGFTQGALLGLGVMMSLALFVSIYSSYAGIALSMGASRKGFFVGTQVMKVLSVIGLFGAIYINDLITPLIYGTNAIYSPREHMLIFSLCLFFATMGESIGIICVRFGKLGMYIYIGVCMLFGAMAGMFAVLGTNGDADFIADFILNLNANVILAAVICVSVVISAINWFIFRKTAVKGV